MGTPKSRRGSRAVPLAQRLAVELERHYQASHYQGDSDLVFGHPLLGVPLDRSKVLKRFKATLRAGGVRAVRFHEYADVRVMPTRLRRFCSGRFLWRECRHNQSASRKARSASGGW